MGQFITYQRIKKNSRTFWYYLICVLLFGFLYYLIITSNAMQWIASMAGLKISGTLACHGTALLISLMITLYMAYLFSDWLFEPHPAENAKRRIDAFVDRSSNNPSDSQPD